MIRDDDLYDILVKGCPAGVHMVSLMDCCHSGTYALFESGILCHNMRTHCCVVLFCLLVSLYLTILLVVHTMP